MIGSPLMNRQWLAVLAMAAGGACAQQAQVPEGDPTPMYLALGDSVAYGYNPTTAERMGDGYPEVLSSELGIEVANASCPGEASGGFISPTGTDNGCRENRVKYGLHVSYDTTQLVYAETFLREHPGTQLVTLDIGGNDASILNDACMAKPSCVLGGFVGLLTTYGQNVDLILGEIRKVYDGPLVGLAIYDPTPENTIAEYGLTQLNKVFADKLALHGGVFADGMAAMKAASPGSTPCDAGLLVKLPDGTCDIHPSAMGHQVLADAISAAMPQ